MGFRRLSVFKLVMYESTLVTGLGGFLGLVAGLGLISFISGAFLEAMLKNFLKPYM